MYILFTCFKVNELKCNYEAKYGALHAKWKIILSKFYYKMLHRIRKGMKVEG